jgi:hypothetical protein
VDEQVWFYPIDSANQRQVMRKLILLFVCLVALTKSAGAQGTIQFLNTSLSKIGMCISPNLPPVDAPVGTVVGVFWGFSRENLALQPHTVIVQTPGLFNGGVAYPLFGSNPGDQVYLKIAAWYNRSGPTPAQLIGPFDSRITDYGESAVVTARLGPPTGPGTVVWQSSGGTNPDRMKPFNIGPLAPDCPEPSTVAIGAVGLALCVLLRRNTTCS